MQSGINNNGTQSSLFLRNKVLLNEMYGVYVEQPLSMSTELISIKIRAIFIVSKSLFR